MDYSKIIVLQNQNRFSNKEMGEVIGMSDVGYDKMIKNHTCRVEYIEKLSGHFKVPISYFFEDKEGYYSKQEPNSNVEKERIIEAQKKTIETSEKYISTLEELLHSKKGTNITHNLPARNA